MLFEHPGGAHAQGFSRRHISAFTGVIKGTCGADEVNIDLKAVATGKQQTWLPAKEVKKLLGISKVALHNSRGRFVTKQALSNGGAQYLFLLSSLPGDAQAKYLQAIAPSIQPTPEDGHTGLLPVIRSSFPLRSRGLVRPLLPPPLLSPRS